MARRPAAKPWPTGWLSSATRWTRCSEGAKRSAAAGPTSTASGPKAPRRPPVTSGSRGNFAARLAAAARRRPDHPALIWDGGALSWRELEERAAGMARRLARQGVGGGDVIALLLPNTWGLAAALWAGLALGATVAPLNPLLAADERERILGHLHPAAV